MVDEIYMSKFRIRHKNFIRKIYCLMCEGHHLINIMLIVTLLILLTNSFSHKTKRKIKINKILVTLVDRYLVIINI